MGRWVLGQRGPTLPPPMTAGEGTIAAVSGVYQLPGWQRLLDAEAEAADLVTAHRPRIDATTADVLDLFGGSRWPT